MVEILPARKGWGHYFAEGLGTGLSSGLKKSFTDQFKQQEQKKKDLATSLKGFSSTFDKYTKAFKEEIPGQFGKQMKESVMLKAKKLFSEGQYEDPEDAIRAAWTDELREKAAEAQEEPGFFKSVGENIYGAAAKLGSKALEVAQFPLDVLKNLGEQGRKAVYKMSGMSPEEIEQREQKFASDIKAGEEATGIINPLAGTSLPQGLANLTEGRSVPKTSGQRIAQGGIFGIPGIVAEGVRELGESANLPGPLKEALSFASFLLAARGKLGSRINANIRTFAPIALNRARKIGAKVEKPPEQVLKDVVNEKNVDMNKVNAGEGREIKKLNDALNAEDKKASDLFKRSEKFSRKTQEQIRQDTAKKLAQSPLEKYYEPTIKEPVTAEGQAAKELRQAPVKAKRDVLLKEIKEPAFLEKSPLEREAKLHELREAEFELKYGRKPATQADIEKQIEKQHAEMRQYIEDPTATKIEKIQKQLKKDKEAVTEAQRLADRGELPGARVIDEFIKIHEQYLKGYDKLTEELADFVRKNKPVKGREPQVQRAQELQKLIQEMAEAGRAKVKIQTDKRKALGALEKPSGAFYKNILKEIQPEIDNFQRQLFKVNKVLAPESVKARKVAKQTLGKAEPSSAKSLKANTEKVTHTAKEALENPTSGATETLSKETGVPEETLGDYLKRLKGGIKGLGKNPSEQSVIKKVSEVVFPTSFAGLKKSVKNGLILGTTAFIFDEAFGWRIPTGILSALALPLGVYGSGFTYGVRGALEKGMNHLHAHELKKYRYQPDKFKEKINSLNKKYSKARLNKIMKIMKESDQSQ